MKIQLQPDQIPKLPIHDAELVSIDVSVGWQLLLLVILLCGLHRANAYFDPGSVNNARQLESRLEFLKGNVLPH